MPAITCPFPGCDFEIAETTEPVLAAAQLNLHALTHTHATAVNQHHIPQPAKQKPPKIPRPVITKDTSEEDWNTFVKKWNLFKNGTDIPATQITTHLWQCCDPDLETELFKDVQDIATTTETQLLNSIKKLAVISIAASTRRAEFLALHQDHGQPIRSFAAKVKGKAQTCAFKKDCNNCEHSVDYTDEMVKYVVISGIADEEIKKEVLGIPDLDEKSLNDTVATIESKEIAARAVATSVTHLQASALNTHHQPSSFNTDLTKDMQNKLSIKTNCKSCKKLIQKFKLRRKGQNKVLKEFQLCVDCWRKENVPSQSKDTAGALFDSISTINMPTNKKPTPKPSKSPRFQPLDHYVFDGSYGWMVAESKPQPSIKLKIHTDKSDYEHLNIPYRHVKSTSVTAITDTGAQSSLMGIKTFKKCGFRESDLVPVKRKMRAANNEGIQIKGAIFTRLSGTNNLGQRVETAEMIYVTESTDLFYLSRRAMENLQIITKDFPSINTVTDAPASPPAKSDTTQSANYKEPCPCKPRQQPPPRPSKLPFTPNEENVPKMREWLINRYSSSTFNRCTHQKLPTMSGPPIKLNVDPDAIPTAVHTPAPIPIHWREKVKQQLDEDVRLGVIEKVEPNTPNTWCHRAIWTRKPDGNPRRVVDFQSLNKHCIRDTYHTVSPFHQARSIPPRTYRTVTDAWNGYHSVPVDSSDRHYLTFITEFGRYRYCGAPQGFIASGDGYTHRYDQIIADVPQKTKCVDDTALWDDEIEDHWWRIIDYLELTGRKGIVLNPSPTKFQFCQKEIDFAGFHVTENEVRPLDKYLDAIRQFPTPKNISDIRSWFGLINQVSHYSQLSKIMLPFKPLLSPKTPFHWSEELQTAFEQSKVSIIESIKEGVRIFDPKLKTCLSPDWSKTGMGYWLYQKHCDCVSEKPKCCDDGWKVTLAGSRFLKPAWQNYAPIEGESLAIAWALEDTKFFTMGCDDLVILTDHEPLTSILSDKALDEITNPRIFSLKQRTLPWRFKILHIPGKMIPASDATSRKPAVRNYDEDDIFALFDSMEETIVAAVKSDHDKIHAVTWERVRSATKDDPYMQLLIDTIINGFPDDASQLPAQLQPYWQYRNQLSVVDHVVMFRDRTVIPPVLRQEVCNSLHSAHQGTTGMSERAKQSVFWPGISQSIQTTRNNCNTCWKIAPSQPHLPPVEPSVPTSPFEAIASDYFKLHDHWYLVVVDRFSNWPHVTKVEHNPSTIGAKGLIRALKRFFATFGVAHELSSDGGPEFTANETEDFLKRWGVNHRLSSAYNPRSNGRAEVSVKAMKRLLRDNVAPNGSIDTESYTRAILQFRNTPDPSTGTSPSEVIFGRTLRDVLPIRPPMQLHNHDSVKPSWKHLWSSREEELRQRSAKQMNVLSEKSRPIDPLNLGDVCRIQNQSGRYPRRWDKLGTVVEVAENDQYILRIHGSDRVTLRNRKYLRRVMNLHPTIVRQPTPVIPHVNDTNIPLVNRDVTSTFAPTNGKVQPVTNHLDITDEPTQPHTNKMSETVDIATEKGMNSTPKGVDPAPPTNDVQPENNSTNVNISERPKRNRKPPHWHKDYVISA